MQAIFLDVIDARKGDSRGLSTRRATGPVDKIIRQFSEVNGIGERLKDWLMGGLLAVFVVLYALAFAGKLDPFENNSMLLRFEPIIFIFLGYYFGRLPSRQTEKILHDEIARQSQKADAAQFAKEKAQQERDALEERIRGARATLATADLQSGTKRLLLRIFDQ